MKISILGAGDVSKISRHAGMPEEQVEKLIDDVGKFLARNKHEIIILPARGVPYRIAQAYQRYNGPKVIGVVPKGDIRYGIEHIKQYRGIEDEEVDVPDWYNLNGEIACMGDVAIVIGFSPGVLTEIAMMKYHFKYLNSNAKLVIFRNTISAPMHQELEEDLKNIFYVTTVEALGEILK